MNKNLIIEFDEYRIVVSGEAREEMQPDIWLQLMRLNMKGIKGLVVFKDEKLTSLSRK